MDAIALAFECNVHKRHGNLLGPSSGESLCRTFASWVLHTMLSVALAVLEADGPGPT